MNSAAKTIFTWGILMILFGCCYLFLPNTFLPLAGLPPTTEVWVRMVGLLIAILGGYYLYCARCNDLAFFRASVPGRIIFALGLAVFVLLGFSKPGLLLLSAVDTFGAFWTWQSLKTSNAGSAMNK